MTFVGGGLVEASDYNTLVDQGTPDIGDIFGTGTGDIGYGGNSTNVSLTDLPIKSAAQLITNEDWLDLRNMFADIAAHQGNTLPDGLPSITLLEDGDLIAFLTQLDSATNVAAIDGINRFDEAGESFTTTSKLTSVRTTAWSSNIIHDFTVDFGGFDAARHYFNTGGTVRLSASRVGGSANAQNSDWSTLVSTAGTVSFRRTDTIQSGAGGSPTAIGYYDLTGSFQTVFTQFGTGAYSTNRWDVLARRDDGPGTNGANGSVLRFRSSFVDAHVGIGGGPDTVDGTFTSTIEERRSSGVFIRPTNTFTTLVNLTFGS